MNRSSSYAVVNEEFKETKLNTKPYTVTTTKRSRSRTPTTSLINTSSSPSVSYSRSRSRSLSKTQARKCKTCILWQNLYQIFEFLVNGRLLINELDEDFSTNNETRIKLESIAINLNDASRIDTCNKYDYLYNCITKLKSIKNPIDPSDYTPDWNWNYKCAKYYKLLKLKLKLINQISLLSKLYAASSETTSDQSTHLNENNNILCKYCNFIIRDKHISSLKTQTIDKLNAYVNDLRPNLERVYDRFYQQRLKHSFPINNLGDLNSFVRQTYQPTWQRFTSDLYEMNYDDQTEINKKIETCANKIHNLLDFLVYENLSTKSDYSKASKTESQTSTNSSSTTNTPRLQSTLIPVSVSPFNRASSTDYDNLNNLKENNNNNNGKLSYGKSRSSISQSSSVMYQKNRTSQYRNDTSRPSGSMRYMSPTNSYGKTYRNSYDEDQPRGYYNYSNKSYNSYHDQNSFNNGSFENGSRYGNGTRGQGYKSYESTNGNNVSNHRSYDSYNGSYSRETNTYNGHDNSITVSSANSSTSSSTLNSFNSYSRLSKNSTNNLNSNSNHKPHNNNQYSNGNNNSIQSSVSVCDTNNNNIYKSNENEVINYIDLDNNNIDDLLDIGKYDKTGSNPENKHRSSSVSSILSACSNLSLSAGSSLSCSSSGSLSSSTSASSMYSSSSLSLVDDKTNKQLNNKHKKKAKRHKSKVKDSLIETSLKKDRKKRRSKIENSLNSPISKKDKSKSKNDEFSDEKLKRKDKKVSSSKSRKSNEDPSVAKKRSIASSSSASSKHKSKRFKLDGNLDETDLIDSATNSLSLITEIKKNKNNEKQQKKSKKAKSHSKKKHSKHHYQHDQLETDKIIPNDDKKLLENSDNTIQENTLVETEATDESIESNKILIFVEFEIVKSAQAYQEKNLEYDIGEIEELSEILPVISLKLTNFNVNEYIKDLNSKNLLLKELNDLIKKLELRLINGDLEDENFISKIDLIQRVLNECFDRIDMQQSYLNYLKDLFLKFNSLNTDNQNKPNEDAINEWLKQNKDDLLTLQIGLVDYARANRLKSQYSLIQSLPFNSLVDILERFLEIINFNTEK